MTRLKVIFGVIIVFGITIAVLLNNKSKMQAKSKNDDVHFLPVTLTPVVRQRLSEEIALVGTIVASYDVAVTSETQGKITKVYANVGDKVSAGEVLIQVDDELRQAAYTTVEVNYEKAQKDYRRYQTMIRDKSVSDAQLEGARLAFKAAEAQYITARRQFNDTKIKSPISGVVSSRPVDVGTMVQNNNVVANVVDISRLKVRINVAEKDVFKMKVGDKVQVSTDVYPGVVFNGKISTISDKADEGHTYPVEVVLANSADHPLRAGMFGRVLYVSEQTNESLSIPREALVGSMKQPQVYVVENSIAHLRPVVISGEFDANLGILSGLKEGETVVVNGQNNLKDNVAVTVVK